MFPSTAHWLFTNVQRKPWNIHRLSNCECISACMCVCARIKSISWECPFVFLSVCYQWVSARRFFFVCRKYFLHSSWVHEHSAADDKRRIRLYSNSIHWDVMWGLHKICICLKKKTLISALRLFNNINLLVSLNGLTGFFLSLGAHKEISGVWFNWEVRVKTCGSTLPTLHDILQYVHHRMNVQ